MVSVDSVDLDKFGAFERFLEEFDRLMLSNARAALDWVDNASNEIREENDWFICRAEALRNCDGPARAAEFLEAGVADEPEFADAHCCLADLYQEQENSKMAIEHSLITLRLDSVTDLVTSPESEGLRTRMAEEAGRALAALAPKLKQKLESSTPEAPMIWWSCRRPSTLHSKVCS